MVTWCLVLASSSLPNKKIKGVFGMGLVFERISLLVIFLHRFGCHTLGLRLSRGYSFLLNVSVK